MKYSKTGKLRVVGPPTNCINRCIFCESAFSSKPFNFSALRAQEDIAHAKRAIDAYGGLGVPDLIIAGSDPCQLKYGLIEIIDYIYSKGFNIKNIQTHGRTFIDENYVEALSRANKGFKIIIPLYGSTRTLNDSIMCPRFGSAFDDAIIGIKNCLKYGIPVEGNTRIIDQNKEDIENIIYLYKTLGITKIHIGRVFESEKNPEEMMERINILLQKYPECLKNIYDNQGPQLVINTKYLEG